MSESYIATRGLSGGESRRDTDENRLEGSGVSDTSNVIPGLRLNSSARASENSSMGSTEDLGTPMRKKHDSIPKNFRLFVTETITPKSKKASQKTLSDWEKKQVKSTQEALIAEADVKVDMTKCLGEGSFGSVFRGTYKGEDVAIKRIQLNTPGRHRRSKDAPPTPQQYLDREISLIMNLSHKNLVKLHGVVLQPPNRLLLVMEYLSGGNMRQFWQSEKEQGRPNDWKELARNLAGAAEGLDYLHSIEVIHRDIKTENLALSDRSVSKRCVLLDFGLARKESLTGRMTIVGTDSFMSPEVMLGEDYSISADIFSFGVVIAEMICRILPNTSVTELVEAASDSKDLSLFRKLAAKRGCPGALVSLACSCLEYEPCDRPDASALVETLQSLSGLVAESDSSDDDDRPRVRTAEEDMIESPAVEGSTKESDASATEFNAVDAVEEGVRAESVIRDRSSSDVPSRGSKALTSTRVSKETVSTKDDSVAVETGSELLSSREEAVQCDGSNILSVGRRATRAASVRTESVSVDAVVSKTTGASSENTATATAASPEGNATEQTTKKKTTTKKKKKKKKGTKNKHRRASKLAESIGLDLSKVHVGVAPSKSAASSTHGSKSQRVENIEIFTTSEALLKRAKGPSSKGRSRRRPKRREKKKPLLTSNSGGSVLAFTSKNDAQQSESNGTACGICALF